jgi:FtsP/CotA-like multicopper oxidase with cupredoxin domain
LPNANVAQVYAMDWAMQHGISIHASRSTASTASTGSMRGTESMSGMSSTGTRSELHGASTRQTRNPYALAPGGRRSASPGEQQFWRVVNAGADTYLDLQVDNTTMQIIALDGVPLASGVGTPASMTVTLPPGSRVKFSVTGPPAGARAYVRTNCFDSGPAGDPMPAALLAAIDPSPPTATAAAPAAEAKAALRSSRALSPQAQRFRFPSSVRRTRSATIAQTRTIYYSDQNTINGAAYDPAAAPMFYAQSGTVEEWNHSK